MLHYTDLPLGGSELGTRKSRGTCRPKNIRNYLGSCLYLPILPLLDIRVVETLGPFLCETHGSDRYEGTVVGYPDLHLRYQHDRFRLSCSHHRSLLPIQIS